MASAPAPRPRVPAGAGPMVLDRTCPGESVKAGVCVPGPVWLAGKAKEAGHSGTDPSSTSQCRCREPGIDRGSLLPFRQLADRFTLIFYDHRCNGRSAGAPVSSMTWENLAADAEALRQELGVERWAVLGHSLGGMVALEAAPAGVDLRRPRAAEGLDGHGPPGRDQGTDAGDGRARRRLLPPRAPGPAGCGHPPRTPTDHRARRSLPLLRAAGRGDGGGHHGHGQGDSRDHGPYRAEGSREGISEVPHLAGWCERRAAARGVIDRAVLASLTDGSIALSPLRPARQTKAPTYGRIGSGRTRRMSPVAAPGR